MTRDEIAQLTDEQLFFAVAERMGYSHVRREIRFTTAGEQWLSYSGTIDGYRERIDNPVTDIGTAWKLVEEAQAEPDECFFSIAMTPAIPYKGRPCWHVELGLARGHASTAARAICEAWLAWRTK